MPHIIEGNNHLFSPDYWNGIDIATYQGPMPKLNGGVLGDCAENARDVLGDAGEEILDGMYWEETVPLGTSLAQGYADGTVFIIDTEILTKVDVSDNFWDAKLHADSPPIEEPYANHWRTKQNPHNTERPLFGDEAAYSPETKRLYFRSLHWGVLLTTPEKERQMAAWPLDYLWVSHAGMALQPFTSMTDAPDIVLTRDLVSLDGNVHVNGTYDAPDFRRGLFRRTTTAAKMTATGLTRVRNLHIISTAEGVLPPVPSTFDFGDVPQPLMA